MRVLITGINGFVGSYLAHDLLDDGHEVWGTTQPGTSNACLGEMCRQLKLMETELTSALSVKKAVRKSRPERVIHLAAQSHVPTSWADPVETCRVNVEGTLNLLKAASAMRKHPRVLLISSGDVYGSSSGTKGVLSETSLPVPLNPYAASKVSAEMFARCIYKMRKIPIIILRPFNHIGPGQSPAFVTSDFAGQIAAIEAGLQKPTIKVGDLSARKDFTDVRDMVRAYLMAIESCPPGEIFNVCSGKTHSIKKMLDILIKISGVNVQVVQEKGRLRATKSPDTRASADAFKRVTGWKPQIPFEKTLGDILDYWREQVGHKK